jgi:hypothetical protein
MVVKEGKLFPSTLVGSLAGSRNKLTYDRLIGEKQFTYVCNGSPTKI